MAPSPVDQFHIASMIVQFQFSQLSELKRFIDGFDGAEIGLENASKLVILLEAENEQRIVDFIDAIQLKPGVLSANLVYHFNETETTA